MRARPPRRDLLIAGHVNVDRFLRVRRFPEPDRTEPVESERQELGGTATNLALVAGRLGLDTGLLARVGDGFPPEFRRRLAAAGLDLRGLLRVRGVPTPCCTIIEDRTGATRVLMQQGPMDDPGPRGLPPDAQLRARWLHLSTGSPRYYLRLAEHVRRIGGHVSLDPAQEIFYRWDRSTFLRALRSVDILFGNAQEIRRAAEWAGGGPAKLLPLVPLVVRTEGPEGATAFSRTGSVHVAAARPRRVRSLVGAGDSFRGGFYAGWLSGRPIEACLRLGSVEARRWIEGGRN